MNTSSGKFPLVVRAMDGEVIARLNPDENRTWSVKWSHVGDQAFAPLDVLNVGQRAFAQLLWAAKDNFRTSPWEISHSWGGVEFSIGPQALEPQQPWAFSLMGLSFDLIAAVNLQGEWLVDWGVLQQHRGRDDLKGDLFLAPVGVIELLWAAKDNFRALPFPASSV